MKTTEQSAVVVTVAAWKGGVGKTTLAAELAWQLGAVLVDLDWDQGGASRAWGYRHEARTTAPLLDALERGRTPRPLRGARKADLVPSHPDLAAMDPDPDTLATALERWAAEWGRPVVVDTHPGGVATTYGALAAASTVLVPAVLATKELAALEGMLAELPDYPLLVIPNKVPPIPPAAELKRLTQIVTGTKVAVGPPVSEYRWLARRKLRVAVTSADPMPVRVAPFAEEIRAVAEAVGSYVRAA